MAGVSLTSPLSGAALPHFLLYVVSAAGRWRLAQGSETITGQDLSYVKDQEVVWVYWYFSAGLRWLAQMTDTSSNQSISKCLPSLYVHRNHSIKMCGCAEAGGDFMSM